LLFMAHHPMPASDPAAPIREIAASLNREVMG
jgi:hypothetical protein